MNILVAEDEILNSMLIERVLQKMGHYCTVVANGQHVIQQCNSQLFDLLIVDVSMPVLDGLKAIETIRNTQNANKHTPILLLSATYPQNYNQIKELYQIQDIVLKPFTVQDISKKIEIIQQK
jgi:CheY-like chemotaxis protein